MKFRLQPTKIFNDFSTTLILKFSHNFFVHSFIPDRWFSWKLDAWNFYETPAKIFWKKSEVEISHIKLSISVIKSLHFSDFYHIIVMKTCNCNVHQSLWDVKNTLPQIYRLVKNKFCLFHMNCYNSEFVKIWFWNQLFCSLSTPFQANINVFFNISLRFAKHRIIHFSKIFSQTQKRLFLSEVLYFCQYMTSSIFFVQRDSAVYSYEFHTKIQVLLQVITIKWMTNSIVFIVMVTHQ